MRLSARQGQFLLQVLIDSLKCEDNAGMFAYDLSSRNDLYNNILNQQSHDLKELDIGEGEDVEDNQV